MSQSLEHFKKLKEIYLSQKFKDTSSIASFLRDYKNDEMPDDYLFVSAMVETMSSLRFKAEETPYAVNSAYSKRRELPIEIKDIESEFLDSDNTEPPISIITIIAQKHIPMLRLLAENLNKVLRRIRQKKNISSIQQIDSYCLQWISKQAGNTIVEKAGSKQELLSVIREESFQTLENRVFKDFLKKCLKIANIYIKTYGGKFSNSERIKAVKRLLNLAKVQLESPIIKGISNLYEMPTPNYTLQYNSNYFKVWTLYRQLVAQMRVFELVWKDRQHLFNEIFHLSFICLFSVSFNCVESIFETKYWLSFLPKNGRFIFGASPLNLYKLNDFIYKIEIESFDEHFIKIKLSEYNLDGDLIKEKLYIPLFLEKQKSIIIEDCFNNYIVYSLNKEDLKDNISYISSMKDFLNVHAQIEKDFPNLK